MNNRAKSLDIPLLRAFVAIYETGNVTTAADQLALTQPTLSYALAKLRTALNDPLFVRDGRLLSPTRRAQECFGKFKEILLQLDELTDETKPFDALRSSRRFNLAMSDVGALVYLPPLLRSLQKVAPNIEIKIRQMPPKTVPEALDVGEIDAAIGNMTSFSHATASAVLSKGKYTCLVATEHPTIKDNLSLDAFRAARHIHVSSELTTHQRLEHMLRDVGVIRKIALEVQQFTVLPHLIRSTDLVAVLPESIGRLFLGYGGLKLLPLPVALPHYDVRIHWNQRQSLHTPQIWLVNQLIETWAKESSAHQARQP